MASVILEMVIYTDLVWSFHLFLRKFLSKPSFFSARENDGYVLIDVFSDTLMDETLYNSSIFFVYV